MTQDPSHRGYDPFDPRDNYERTNSEDWRDPVWETPSIVERSIRDTSDIERWAAMSEEEQLAELDAEEKELESMKDKLTFFGILF